jgi:hypothetical protein
VFKIVVDGQTYNLNIALAYDSLGFIDAGGTATSSKTYTYSVAAATSNASQTLTIGFYFGGKSITSFKTPSSTDLVLNTDYTVGADSIILTNSRLKLLSTGAKVFTLVVNGVTYSLNIAPTT